jgi:hypothetical protein
MTLNMVSEALSYAVPDLRPVLVSLKNRYTIDFLCRTLTMNETQKRSARAYFNTPTSIPLSQRLPLIHRISPPTASKSRTIFGLERFPERPWFFKFEPSSLTPTTLIHRLSIPSNPTLTCSTDFKSCVMTPLTTPLHSPCQSTLIPIPETTTQL